LEIGIGNELGFFDSFVERTLKYRSEKGNFFIKNGGRMKGITEKKNKKGNQTKET
jgi:hypothetical protein